MKTFKQENFQTRKLSTRKFSSRKFSIKKFFLGQMGTYGSYLGMGGEVSLGRQRQRKINSVRFECKALKPNRIDCYAP